MPTWRVAEQLPAELGAVDLVIIDEASQSDVTELPALLRGKKILVVGDDRQNSVFAFVRYGDETAAPVLVVCNMTPMPRIGYRIGVPRPGSWHERLNTDAACYGGSGMGNSGTVATVPVQSHGEAQCLQLTLPPLATLFLRPGG